MELWYVERYDALLDAFALHAAEAEAGALSIIESLASGLGGLIG